jgi:tetratricopeptide (TPR) repeat protein
VEGHLEKALRLFHSNQMEAAFSALDEGLRKAPGNPLLTIRKALMLIEQERFTEARDLMGPLALANPQHAAAQSLFIRILVETDGPQAAAGRLQQTLSQVKPETRKAPAMIGLIEAVGVGLGEFGMVPAAIAHLELAGTLRGEAAERRDSPLRSILGNRHISLWLKAPYRLSPVPEGLDDAKRGRFSAALEKAAQGLWGPAAADFDALAREGTAEADRNLGLCRLWLGDHSGAVEALRRHTRWVGPTPDSVELEALCQIIEPIRDDDKVELLQWIWPVRDPSALAQALDDDDRSVHQGLGPMNPDDPDSPEVDVYVMTDRPRPAEGTKVESPDELPKVEGRVLLGQEIVAVEAFDDGRLERLSERFKALAGGSVTPAHPRSKEVGMEERAHLAMRTEWVTPEKISDEDLKRLKSQEIERVYSQVWPETPEPYLDGRSPLQAAKDGNAELPLRSALEVLERNETLRAANFDLAVLRDRLGVPSEPEIDPETVDLATVPVTRLYRIDPAKLSDETLVALLDLGEKYGLAPEVQVRIARALIDRPELLDGLDRGVRRVLVYAHVAGYEAANGNLPEALAWLNRGRASDPAEVKEANAVRWDTLELRLRSQAEHPSAWVPFLAAVLERYAEGGPHTDTLVLTLINMGLIQLQPHPDRPDDYVMDTRTLQMVMEQFGPKITTASGRLGVSVTGGKVWTPESEAGASGGVWTPGQSGGSAQDEAKPRLIIPGR